MKTSLLPVLLGAAALLPSTASAQEGFQIDAAWRPTLRRAYIFYGNDTDQIPLGALIAGKAPDAESGVANSLGELGRFEARLRYGLTDDLALYTGVMGGPFEVQFTSNTPSHRGTDWNFDIGGSITRQFNDDFRFETQMGGRVRVWALGAPEVPLHGNIGLVLAVKPQYKGWSLLVEGTLAAVWLTDLTAWGAQKDSSILRIRPAYTWDRERFALSAGLDYYHTHTEFFGTQLIPGQEAFMLDDFDLALVLGGTWKL